MTTVRTHACTVSDVCVFTFKVLDFLKDFITKNERKIVANKKRLEAEESPDLEAKAQEMHELGIQIGEKLAKAETLGTYG